MSITRMGGGAPRGRSIRPVLREQYEAVVPLDGYRPLFHDQRNPGVTPKRLDTDPDGTSGWVGVSPEIEEALCQAHKMETLGQMADGLAHNFNNLLQGVLSAMNLMRSRIQPRDRRELDFLIGHAFTAVEGVGGLTGRLLDFSRPRRPEPRTVELNTVIAAMQPLLRCALLPRFDLKIESGVGPMRTACDPHQLESTILDLILNARDAMPAGGEITIKTEYADLATERMGLPRGRYVSLCVADTGFGMSAEALARVFDPFYTTKTTGQRVGLGLPLAELFVDRFRGHIGIDSIVGRGTRVRLYLPEEET